METKQFDHRQYFITRLGKTYCAVMFPRFT